jgi:hypothetical protein
VARGVPNVQRQSNPDASCLYVPPDARRNRGLRGMTHALRGSADSRCTVGTARSCTYLSIAQPGLVGGCGTRPRRLPPRMPSRRTNFVRKGWWEILQLCRQSRSRPSKLWKRQLGKKTTQIR